MPEAANPKLRLLFLLITGVGAAHVVEQIVFGIEEYRLLRGLVDRWHALFPVTWGDQASVLLITMIFVTVSMMIYGLMRGGVAALAVIGLFGLLGASEAHHWIEAVQERAYDPGLVTSFAYVALGGMIVVEVWRALTVNRRRAQAD